MYTKWEVKPYDRRHGVYDGFGHLLVVCNDDDARDLVSTHNKQIIILEAHLCALEGPDSDVVGAGRKKAP